jgi:phosphoglycerate kinase
MLMPSDVVCTYDLNADRACCQMPLTSDCCSSDAPCIPDTAFGADIGPDTCTRYVDALRDCQCIFWNGPMGKFELSAFASGTEQVARAVAAATQRGATTVVGGRCHDMLLFRV